MSTETRRLVRTDSSGRPPRLSHSSWTMMQKILRLGPIITYTRPPAGGTYYPICMSPRTVSAWLAFLMPFLASVDGYPSSSPHAYWTPNKSMPTLHYTQVYRSMPWALTKCSPLDLWRLSIACTSCPTVFSWGMLQLEKINGFGSTLWSGALNFLCSWDKGWVVSTKV